MPSPARIPDASHPIHIEPVTSRIVVSIAGQVIAATQNALALREAAYPVVYYIPRRDVDMAFLQRNTHTSYCPYKGDCNYYSASVAGRLTDNVGWTYETPYESVALIQNHIAFYPDRVDLVKQSSRI